jgi:hypothetical protein
MQGFRDLPHAQRLVVCVTIGVIGLAIAGDPLADATGITWPKSVRAWLVIPLAALAALFFALPKR